MASTQERYFDVLMDRVRQDRYPSHQLLDRVEAALLTSDQIAEYCDLLVEKIDESWYPSGQLMNRLQRMLSFMAHATSA
jgi:hypothetical protein